MRFKQLLIPLTSIEDHERAVIHELNGGHGFIKRLMILGLTPGAEIIMEHNYHHGPLVIALGDSRIAIGRGEGAKVIVQRISYNK